MDLNNSFEVSVIIPVYNAEKYIQNAVSSAQQHSCVKEIILVEDNSPDNALEVCQKLSEKFEIVKLYRHPNGENRGAGASRNLGIEKANSEYIAFLDADDWFEPNRFVAEKKFLAKNHIYDGVFGAAKIYYENKEQPLRDELYTFHSIVKPEDIFHEILRPNGGRFHTNAVTVSKSLIEKVGGFDTSLRLHQDSFLWLKLAYQGKLKCGIIDKPIACYRIHKLNRYSKANRKSANLYHRKVYEEFKNKTNVSKNSMRIIFKNLIINQTSSNNNLIRGIIAMKEILLNPKIILKLW